ncbi:O-antigen ligase family protein [Sphingomonas sp. MMS24-J13]|uniref:O-antigen ligase family protein n=1 Tax=Sphingomonas sp. MMS24-J13 TaxID=3238686 RepID=UPI00384DA1D1
MLLIVATTLLGGSSRIDAASLVVLRPFSIVCLGIALFGVNAGDLRAYRGLVVGAGALVALFSLHLVPLPPAMWMALPGRDLAVSAVRLAGSADAWQPLTLVPWRAWNALFALAAPVAALLLAIRCTDEQRQLLLNLFVGLAILDLLLGVLQVSSGYSASLYFYDKDSPEVATGFFANRNHFAVDLACILPMLTVFPGMTAALRAWLAAALGAVILVMIVLSGSRAGVVIATLALALSVILAVRKRPTDGEADPRRRYFLAFAMLLASALLIMIAIYLARASAVDRIIAMRSDDEMRLRFWPPIVKMIWQYFPEGSGIASFVEVFQIAEPRPLLSFSYLNHAHNDWLEFGLEMGLPGMILAFVGVIGWGRAIVSLARARRRDHTVRLGRIGGAVILLLGLASLVDYPLRTPSVACMAAVAIVWMAAGARRARANGDG